MMPLPLHSCFYRCLLSLQFMFALLPTSPFLYILLSVFITFCPYTYLSLPPRSWPSLCPCLCPLFHPLTSMSLPLYPCAYHPCALASVLLHLGLCPYPFFLPVTTLPLLPHRFPLSSSPSFFILTSEPLPLDHCPCTLARRISPYSCALHPVALPYVDLLLYICPCSHGLLFIPLFPYFALVLLPLCPYSLCSCFCAILSICQLSTCQLESFFSKVKYRRFAHQNCFQRVVLPKPTPKLYYLVKCDPHFLFIGQT